MTARIPAIQARPVHPTQAPDRRALRLQSLSQLLGALGANTQTGQFDPQSILFSTLFSTPLNAGVISGN